MFRLNIECSKDIDEIHINFSDGTSVVKSGGTEQGQNTRCEDRPGNQRNTQESKRTDGFLDLDTEFGGVSQEVVRPPEITREEKPVKVADELQNFDF